MKRLSSRLDQKRILRSIEEEKQREAKEIADEIERKGKEQRVKERIEKQRMKEEQRKQKQKLKAEREEEKRKKMKAELENGSGEERDVAGTCSSNGDSGSDKSEKQQPVKKKKPNHKLRFKVRLTVCI